MPIRPWNWIREREFQVRNRILAVIRTPILLGVGTGVAEHDIEKENDVNLTTAQEK